MIATLPEKLEDALEANHVVTEVLGKWAEVALPNCWIVAGVIVQSYWNAMHELPPLHGVNDIDLIYFDSTDLAETSESGHALRISGMFDDLGVRFDVKNEARVHLWYESRFGYAIEPYASSEDAIDTFPTTAGSVGIRPANDAIESYTTFGFDDLLNLVVRPNKRQITREIYAEKVLRWSEMWPLLKIIEWDDI